MHECSYISLRENASEDAVLPVASFDQAYAERSVDKDVGHRDVESVYGYSSRVDIFFPHDTVSYFSTENFIFSIE